MQQNYFSVKIGEPAKLLQSDAGSNHNNSDEESSWLMPLFHIRRVRPAINASQLSYSAKLLHTGTAIEDSATLAE